MTPSELKYQVEQAGHCPHFFTRQTMKFFGDTMRNYGCRDGGVVVTASGETYDCWEVYRKRAVKHGLAASAWFDKVTFERIHPQTEG